MHKILVKSWLLLWILIVSAIVVATGVHEGTKIINQGSLTFQDSSGKTYTVTSNIVETIIQQVYGFIIKPDGTESTPGQKEAGFPGDTILFNYLVTNTGNGHDTIENLHIIQGTNDQFDFTETHIYLDKNCNEELDPNENELSEISLDADDSACLIVIATIPTNAALDDYGNLTITGTSKGDPILDPDGNGTPGDGNNWARAISTSGGVLDIRKSSSPTGYVSPGEIITYTLQGENSGRGAVGAARDIVMVDTDLRSGIFIEDPIPEHTTYLPGSMAGSSDDGQVVFVWRTASGWTASEPAASEVLAVGFVIVAVEDDFFAPDASYDLSFRVVVNENITPENEVYNRAHLSYDGNGDGVADDPAFAADDFESIDSNPTRHQIRPVYGVWIGPSGDADSDGNGFLPSYTDPGGSVWNYTETSDTSPERNNDLQTLTSHIVHTGETIYFRNSVMNRGNTRDRYTLSINAAPEGWACRILDVDGATPISGTVGPLEPGEQFDFVVTCTVPSGNEHAETDPELFNNVVIRAISEGDPTQHNLTTDRVLNIEPELSFDLADRGQSGDGDPSDDDPVNRDSAPGAIIDYPLDATNTGSRPDSYTYSADLPPDWTVSYYADEDCDGTADQPERLIDGSPQLEPGEHTCYVARVTVDPEEQTGDFDLAFHANSMADPNLQDTVHTMVHIAIDARLDIQKEVSENVVQVGDTLTYTLTLVSNNTIPLDVTVSDYPAPHIQYVAGSARSDCNMPESEPAVRSGKLIWSELIMPAGEGVSCQISYEMRVLPGAVNPIKNTAFVEGTGAGGKIRTSSESHAEVLLASGVFQNRRGSLIGRVYIDANGDGAYQRGYDIPLPGARILLENGRQVITDGEGRYSFRDLAWGIWQVMLDDHCDIYNPEPHPESVDRKGYRHRVRVEGLTISDFPLAGPGGRIGAERKTWLEYGPLRVEKELIRLNGVTRIVLQLQTERVLPRVILRDPLPDGSFKEFDLTGRKGAWTISYDLKGEVPLTDPSIEWRAQ